VRRLALAVVVLVATPSAALATELDDLLEQGRTASYSAEQLISCSTPDGARDALVSIEQAGAEIRVKAGAEAEVTVGAGDWSLLRQGGVVEEAAIGDSSAIDESLYEVEDAGSARLLGREAVAYRLTRDGVLRAELVFDEDTGALMRAVTFDAAGVAYCDRRFVSFDPEAPVFPFNEMSAAAEVSPADADEDASFPEAVAGFTRLDRYVDADGLRFAYYSDGFFSFAVFVAPTRVALAEPVTVDLGGRSYQRVFTAGQAIYSWEAGRDGMALVGDLPPDMHEAVLGELPVPTDPGLFRRIWRSLFG
jgi:hypothetical protein